MLCDRGRNDAFTLLILDHLKAKQINYEIIASNHDFEFILTYHTLKKGETWKRVTLTNDPKFAMQSRSMSNLNYLIKRDIISYDLIDEILKRSYFPYLKLISHTIDVEKDSDTIFTHAAVDTRIIKKIAQAFDINYDDTSIKATAESIKKINENFRTYLITLEFKTFRAQLYYVTLLKVGIKIMSFFPL